MIGATMFSGIGAPECAAPGISWAWGAEIDRFAAAVHAARCGSPNLGDVNAPDFADRAADVARPDIVVWGSPCQSFSVAGKRAGLDDPRGDLTLVSLGIVGRLRPRWLVWENVPGVLSIDGGRTFGTVLGLMGQLGYGFAYRVLDARHFGVPQRRRRVFVVGYLGDWRRAAAVLFERASLSGHPAPRREEGESVAAVSGQRADCSGEWPARIAPTLNAAFGDKQGLEDQHALNGAGLFVPGVVAHTLRGAGFDASEDGTGRGTPLVPVPFDTTQITSAANYSRPKPGDPCHPLAAGAHAPAVAFAQNQSGEVRAGAVASTLNTNTNASGRNAPLCNVGTAVRRLTPRECEKLQGFPPDWTAITYRGKPAADGPRYKALGNSMAVPVMRWLLDRVQMVEALP